MWKPGKGLQEVLEKGKKMKWKINELTQMSGKGGICGIINCFNKPAEPTTQCKKCTNYYCSEHFPSHLDILPDGDFEYASSNEGLERSMD